jgi:hypothetical protein
VSTGSIEKKTLQSEGSFDEDPGSESDTLMKVSTFLSPTLASTVVLINMGGTNRPQIGELHPSRVRRRLEEAKLTCRAFYESVYTVVYLDAKNHIAQFECIHPQNAEMSEANVFIESNGNQVGLFFADADRGTNEFPTSPFCSQPATHLIDWANTDCSQVSKPTAIARVSHEFRFRSRRCSL